MFTMIGMQCSKKRTRQWFLCETCLTEIKPVLNCLIDFNGLNSGRLAGTLCEKAHCGKKKRKKGHKRQCPSTLLLDDGGGDHLSEGIIFAFAGGCNVHGGGADFILLESGLEQMRNLRLL